MKKFAGVFMILLFALINFTTCNYLAAAVFPKSGEWPSPMRDKGESGFSPGRGNITNPQCSVLFYAGTTNDYIVFKPQQGHKTIIADKIPASTKKFADGVFELNPPLPDGESIMVYPAGMKGVDFAFGDFLKDAPGLECVALESAFSSPKQPNGDWSKAMIRGYKFQEGNSIQIWQYGPVNLLFQGNPILGDFDGDGKVELAAMAWSNLMLIDAATGKLKDSCEFSNGRNYGYFGVYDLDGNGKKEFVVLADFYKHLDVAGFDPNGKLKILWQKNIELTLTEPNTQVRVNPFCIADINGDGRLEIVVSLFNPPTSAGLSVSNDNRWHVVVYDGMKGNVVADYRDECLAGLVDLDNDGVSEILTDSTDAVSVIEYGTVWVHSLKDGKNVVLWEKNKAGWQMVSPEVSLADIAAPIQKSVSCISGKGGTIMNAWDKRPSGWVKWQAEMNFQVNSRATKANENLLFKNFKDGAVVALKEPCTTPDQIKLNLLQWRNNTFGSIAKVSGKYLQALAIGDDGSVIIRSDKGDKAQALSFSNANPELIAKTKQVPYADVVAIGINNDGKVIGVKQGVSDEEEIIAFEIPRDKNKKAAELWRSRGRFQTTTWPNTLGGTISDINNDGNRQVIFASADEKTGCGKLVVADLASGKIMWQHFFKHIPGTAPVWNSGGVIIWKTGNFTAKDHQDVLVTVRRNVMHSDETYLLSGKDGRILWGRTGEKLHGRGTGGMVFAVADYDKDGYDEAALLYPDILYILDGRTGQDKILETVGKLRKFPDPNVEGYWGSAIAAKFLNNEDYFIFFYTGNETLTGLIKPDFKDRNGEFVWFDAFRETNIIHPAIGDFDGDGCLEAMCFKYKDGVHCYNTADGKIKWKNMDMVKPDAVATADIDGDGKCEVIATAGDKIYCIGYNVIKWTYQMPCQIGPPALADIRGNGLLSIVVAGSDGNVYAVEQKWY